MSQGDKRQRSQPPYRIKLVFAFHILHIILQLSHVRCECGPVFGVRLAPQIYRLPTTTAGHKGATRVPLQQTNCHTTRPTTLTHTHTHTHIHTARTATCRVGSLDPSRMERIWPSNVEKMTMRDPARLVAANAKVLLTTNAQHAATRADSHRQGGTPNQR